MSSKRKNVGSGKGSTSKGNASKGGSSKGRASSNSAAGFDSSRFRSKAHEERYNMNVKGKRVVKDKGFELEQGEYEEIRSQIAERRWQNFCAPRKVGYLSIVEEFYANAFRVENDTLRQHRSWVRGVEIDFSPLALQRFFGVEGEIWGCCFDNTLNSWSWDSDALLRDLCREGASWDLKANNEPRVLKAPDLLPIPKAWFTFCRTSVFPSSNFSEVTVKRAVFCQLAMSGKRIHVHRVIANAINELAQSPQLVIGFPFLITQLCLESGVRVGREPSLSPADPINRKVIDEFAGQKPSPRRAPPRRLPRDSQPASQQDVEVIRRQIEELMHYTRSMGNFVAQQLGGDSSSWELRARNKEEVVQHEEAGGDGDGIDMED